MFTGRLRIRAVGVNPEKLLNAFLDRGMVLEEVRLTGEALEGWVGLWCFRQLPSLARATGCRIRVVGKEGVPFWGRAARRRPVLLAGCVVFSALLYFLSSHVWFIRVEGANPFLAREVARAAASAGLRQGVPQAAVNPTRIEAAIVRGVRGVIWAGLQKDGALVLVRVVSDEKPFAGLEQPGDLMATRDAKVTRVVESAGVAMVRPGEAVKAGQLLISGNLGEGPEGRPILVRAQGVVNGLVEYHGYGEIPLRREEVWSGNGRYRRLIIKVDKMEILISGRGDPPFSAYRVDRRVWRNPWVPVEVITLDFREIKRRVLSLSVHQAEKRAKERALDAIRRRLPPGGRIIGVQFAVGTGSQSVKVEARAIGEENIGVIRAILPNKGES